MGLEEKDRMEVDCIVLYPDNSCILPDFNCLTKEEYKVPGYFGFYKVGIPFPTI